MRRGTPRSFSWSVDTSHSQTLQEVLEIHTTDRNTPQEKTPKTLNPADTNRNKKAKLQPGRGTPKALPHFQVGSWNFSTHPWGKGKIPLGSPVFLPAR